VAGLLGGGNLVGRPIQNATGIATNTHAPSHLNSLAIVYLTIRTQALRSRYIRQPWGT
jgi:hypothetical protein